MFTDRLKYNLNYKPEQYLLIDSSKIMFTSRLIILKKTIAGLSKLTKFVIYQNQATKLRKAIFKLEGNKALFVKMFRIFSA